jgi:hypothetical protein
LALADQVLVLLPLVQTVKIVLHLVRHLLVVVEVQHQIQEQMQVQAVQVAVALLTLVLEAVLLGLVLQDHQGKVMMVHQVCLKVEVVEAVLAQQVQDQTVVWVYNRQ